MAFALYYIGFPLLADYQQSTLLWNDILGIVLFVLGSFINTYSEILRMKWKKDESNKGKLYTGGLFRFSRHINYFGDILWVGGLACMTANIWSIAIPLVLFSFFWFFNIPTLEKHLEQKYEGFSEYKARVKSLIPFIL